jgi:hypothetical protein
MTAKQIQINVQRFSVISAKAFEDVVAAVGHPDLGVFRKDVAASKTYAELENVVRRAIGLSDLMEFARFDLGEVLRKERGHEAARSLRLVAGNPLIMKQMVEHVPDAGSESRARPGLQGRVALGGGRRSHRVSACVFCTNTVQSGTVFLSVHCHIDIGDCISCDWSENYACEE